MFEGEREVFLTKSNQTKIKAIRFTWHNKMEI